MEKKTNKKKKGLTKAQSIAMAGLLIGIAAVLGFFKLPLSSILEIRFQSIPMAIGGAVLGPITGGIVGAASDVICYLVRPTGPFFPGFTISYFLTGLIFGLFLYKRKPVWWRVVLAQVTVTVLVGILLNSIWLSMLYGNAFVAVLTARIVKELVMIPINSAILIAVLNALARAGIGSYGFSNSRTSAHRRRYNEDTDVSKESV